MSKNMTKKWITHSTDGRNIAAMVDAPWVYDVSLIAMYKSKPGTYIIQLAGVQNPEPTKTQVFLCKSLRTKMKPNCFRMIVRKGKEAKFGALNKMCNKEFEVIRTHYFLANKDIYDFTWILFRR